MHKSSLDLNLGQHISSSNNNNYNINIKNNFNNNNSNLSISSSNSNDNECIFNCSNNNNTKQPTLTFNTNNITINNNNNNTKTGRQMMAAQEKKTAEEEEISDGMKEGLTKPHEEQPNDDITYSAEQEVEEEERERGRKLKQKFSGLMGVRGGIFVDESASYESDEYGTSSTERMQLNPSGDEDGWDDEEYDDDEEDDEDDEDEEADDVAMDTANDDDDEAYGDEDTNEGESKVSVVAQARSAADTDIRDTDAAYEALPEAKGLVQAALVGDENESVKNMPNVLKAKSITIHTPSSSDARIEVPEEEEDMGFDEDDERIAIIVERQRGSAAAAAASSNDNNRGFMNEEEEGSGAEANRYKQQQNNRFRLDYLEKYRRKQLEQTNRRGLADAREGSGNFANDDDDDDSDDDDDDDDVNDDDDDDGVGVGVDANGSAAADANDDADRLEGGDGYFNSKHTKSSNRYFRKNTNDAIKIISTPLGKVGIVYQQTPTDEQDGSNSNNNNNKKQDAHSGSDKKTSSFTDFDALSPDPESSHRLASSHPKITPVLTPDGKVALLYRGDSENSKYEPIRNLTHKFNNNNHDFNDNNKANAPVSGTINNKKDTPDFQSNDGSEDESSSSADESDDDYDLDNDSNSNNGVNSRKNGASNNPTDETQKAAIQNPATDSDAPAGSGVSGGSFIIRPTDSVLPIINRPLSEVLGIKKNQFKQVRIKDHPTTPPNVAGESNGDPRSLAGTSIDRTIDTTTLHFLTKVNLAEYPTSMKTRNFDFDFSRDNTMLDERTRFREHQYRQQQQQQQQQLLQQGGGNNVNYPNGGESGNSGNKLNEEVLAKTEVVNLAIIPHFDEELERLQRLREHETRRHYRQRYRQRPSEEDLSGIHCIMQAMMGIAAISTVFGMLGTFFKQRILDQIRLMHW